MARQAEPSNAFASPPRIAAIVFDRDEDVDAEVRDFVEMALRDGVRIAGFVQERGDEDRRDVRLRDLGGGGDIAIMQDLGPGATGCRVDPGAIAVAAGRLAQALAGRPDLVIVNRFGKLECEGGGLSAELAEAVALGLPVVVSVPLRFRETWNAFAGGLDAQLPPRRQALEDWWMRSRPAPADAG
jgi:hypothetical protein